VNPSCRFDVSLPMANSRRAAPRELVEAHDGQPRNSGLIAPPWHRNGGTPRR
jgi:hypothetical protein